MGLISFIRDAVRVLRLVRKPDRGEFTLTLRVVAAGMALRGAVGFVFQLIGSTFQLARVAVFPRNLVLVVLLVLLVIIMGLAAYAYRRYRV